MFKALSALCGALVVSSVSVAGAAGIRGDYVEARTADVFTGPCFSNAEVFIYGKQAIMAWKVTEGAYNGVELNGLSVAAALQASTTLSEDKPDQASAVIIVDANANERQREALIAMARELGGKRLANIVDVKSSRISLKVEAHSVADTAETHAAHGMPHAPRASFWAANLAQIVTRPLDEGDHFCGNEVVAYAPLSKGVVALPAYTLGHQYKGQGLESKWDDPNCRSSYVGRFSL
ncbi:DUF1326 domain-containing protein [Singulisphaera sp. Ch08]|uniref:DUF1326 domain-containing protein n=1 Tax=Singulisphaera sp. Ch08 TaxID=3120278 RepID=A0AAU7CBX5_9BACT